MLEIVSYPYVAKVLSGNRKKTPHGVIEMMHFELMDGRNFYATLNGTLLEGWLNQMALNDEEDLFSGTEWVEVGRRGDESMYMTQLFNRDEFDAAHYMRKREMSKADFEAFRQKHLTIVDCSRELYYGLL